MTGGLGDFAFQAGDQWRGFFPEGGVARGQGAELLPACELLAQALAGEGRFGAFGEVCADQAPEQPLSDFVGIQVLRAFPGAQWPKRAVMRRASKLLPRGVMMTVGASYVVRDRLIRSKRVHFLHRPTAMR